MTEPNPQDRILRTQRSIPHAPYAIYAAFSDPSRLARWWGPKDFKNTFETFAFTAGGDWKFLMHGPDGHNYPNHCVFCKLVAGEEVVLEHVGAPRFTLSITLQPVDAGTQVVWVQEFEDPKVTAAIRHIAEPGNEQNLDRLHQHLNGEL